MKIHLAGTSSRDKIKDVIFQIPFVLESFWYFKPWQVPMIHDTTESFILDSGAFSFIMNGTGNMDLDGYVQRYVDFVKKYEVENYIEMDIDNRIGYEKVRQLRTRIEREVGRPCIPVWHFNRGREDFERMCQEYDYVAFGGMMSDGFTKDELVRVLPWFVRTAHKNGAKIHGLGFTGMSDVVKVHFDTVDSSSWTSGSRYGTLYIFDNGTLRRVHRPNGSRMTAPYLDIDVNNITQWIKFQRYADTHL